MLRKEQQGHDIYGIKYQDLVPILGRRWYVRVLNEGLDFCYVERKTVQYHLHYCKPILDLQPNLDCKCVYGGCVLAFRFVHGNGVGYQWQSFKVNDR